MSKNRASFFRAAIITNLVLVTVVVLIGVIYLVSSGGEKSSSDGEKFYLLIQEDIAEIISHDWADHPKDAYKARNLFDGNPDTIASPADNMGLNYEIRLANFYEIKQIELVLKDQARVIKNLVLEVELDSGEWQIVSEKDTPLKETEIIKVDATTDALRLRAVGKTPMGIYEMKILGRSLRPPQN